MLSRPRFDVPEGKAAKVSIIDSSLRLSGMPLTHLMKPAMKGLDAMPTLTTWSFLVESASGKKAVFDLGVPKEPLKNFSPKYANTIRRNSHWDVDVPKNVADILAENKVQPSEIDSVIWSHHHFDHIGDITTFPRSTELIVGPGFKEAFLPGYPADPDSPVHEADFEGRELKEINFEDKPLQIGPFRAFDFFDNGSFYLLDAPGHDIGHLAGLARTTTSPDTFIFMGGDLCHHGGELRPSKYLTYPSNLSQHLSLSDSLRFHHSQCPGRAFDDMNVKRGRALGETFFDPAIGFDKELATKTIKEAQKADAQDNVFFVFAHDTSMFGVIDTFPKQANNWKEKGWKEKTHWKFLNDFEAAMTS
ncbi:beta-lactamase-like protein [Fusarium redolens]|uniref:Beta-lactamase-like protein n=1 Tax=Fusarium redolens TaxID=48865 RepID=A0A9P9K4S6_FUSRE|nr:beta-lactamase-like protein [Fusarium redolens]KAH7240164.1 beta-lactamase-like protein [Fusarium redolens]